MTETAARLLEQMIHQRRAVERNARRMFDSQWGQFWRCDGCGAPARLLNGKKMPPHWPQRYLDLSRCACGEVAWRLCGYEPPP